MMSFSCQVRDASVAICRKVHSLSEFKHHAAETNDIFLLAAKVIAHVLLRAQALTDKNSRHLSLP